MKHKNHPSRESKKTNPRELELLAGSSSCACPLSRLPFKREPVKCSHTFRAGLKFGASRFKSKELASLAQCVS